MFCRYCGAQLPDDIAFCVKCGKKTVKLHPRTQPPRFVVQTDDRSPVPVPAAQQANPFAGILQKIKAAAAAAADKCKALWTGIRSGEIDLFAFARDFDKGMWAVCGIFLGIEIVSLIELIASATDSKLLLPFLRGVPTPYITAWFLSVVIANVTQICAYNYRHSEEYISAVLTRLPEDHEAQVPSVGAALLESEKPLTPDTEGTDDADLWDDVLADVPAPAESEKQPLTQEAADIIAELEKLSLDL